MEKAKAPRKEGDREKVVDLDDITNSEIEALIDEWVHSERDRRILKRRLIDGICYEPLADEFGLSVRQMKNIVYNAEAKLFKHL